MSEMYAMLLAAGLGTRLGGLSDLLPKPLLPVCNAPLIRWSAALCVHHGIRDLVVNLHHKGELIREELKHGADLGARVTYSPETEIQGTGGGIRGMAALMPRQTCLALNAKIVTDVDLSRVLDFHHRSGAVATMVLRPDANAERWGAIGVNPDSGRVERILEDRRPGAGKDQALMFTGIHVLSPSFIDCIPSGSCCVIRTAYQELLRKGAPIFGYLHQGYFYEHSTPSRYLQGNLNLLQGLAVPAAAPGPLSGVDPSAQVNPGARVVGPVLVGAGVKIEAGAEVGPEVVLGQGAWVGPGVRLRQSVVWPGAEVLADARRAIITSQCIEQVPEMDNPEEKPR